LRNRLLSAEIIRSILDEHLSLGPTKPLSYLPQATITKNLGLAVQAYVDLVKDRGAYAIVLGEDECAIGSGAVYAFDRVALNALLEAQGPVLQARQWPLEAEAFVRQVALNWLEEPNPVLPVVHLAFGDLHIKSQTTRVDLPTE
jgi:hypothetical protein